MPLRVEILVAFTALLFLASLRKPLWGLLMTGFWYFFRPAMWEAEDWLRPVQLWTIAALVGWVLSRQCDKTFRHSLWMVSLLLLMLISTALGTYADDESWQVLWNAVKVFIFVFLLIRLCDTPKRLAYFVAAMVLGCLWNAKAVLYTWYTMGFSGSIRIDTPVAQGGGANFIALYFAGTLPFLILGIFRKKPWQRYVSAALLPIWLAVMVATGSRGGFLAMGAGILVLLVTYRKPWLIIATTVVGLGLCLAAPSEYWNRMGTITAEEGHRDVSAEGRLQNFMIALQMIGDHPIAGVGLHKFPSSAWRYIPVEYRFTGHPTVCHNTYLQLAAETGIVTSLAFIAISGVLLWRLRRRSPPDIPDRQNLEWVRVGTLAGLVATLVNAVFTDQAATDYFWWNYGVGFACLLVVEKFTAKATEATVQSPPTHEDLLRLAT